MNPAHSALTVYAKRKLRIQNLPEDDNPTGEGANLSLDNMYENEKNWTTGEGAGGAFKICLCSSATNVVQMFIMSV